MTKWWMIRAGDHNELIPIWKDQGIASIGWPKLGNPKQYRNKNEMTVKANIVFAESKPNSRSSWVSQVWRFSQEIKKSDRVITYNKENRKYMVGTVLEPHFYDESLGNPAYPNNIKVSWEEITVDRDSLSQAAKNSLGSTLTVFRVDEWGSEIENLIKHPFSDPEPIDDAEEDEIIEDLVGKARVMVCLWQYKNVVFGS